MRIFCLEDNPLIVFHIEQLVEDLGHIFVGAFESFNDLKENFASIDFDGALVDIDLADGRTGPLAAAWLLEQGIPTIFVTGQENIAEYHRNISIAVIGKPITQSDFARKIALFASIPR
jgi:DNA-binding LytR/AlgR family response regulator